MLEPDPTDENGKYHISMDPKGCPAHSDTRGAGRGFRHREPENTLVSYEKHKIYEGCTVHAHSRGSHLNKEVRSCIVK